MGVDLGNLSALRTFRVLRALKTVAVIPGMSRKGFVHKLRTTASSTFFHILPNTGTIFRSCTVLFSHLLSHTPDNAMWFAFSLALQNRVFAPALHSPLLYRLTKYIYFLKCYIFRCVHKWA